MPFVAYFNPLAMGGTEPINIGTWFFTHLFFDLKFMTIFSLLFGAGLIMMMRRAESRGVQYGAIWYRRNLCLMLLGAMHGYLIWMGDILFHYALTGMVIFVFRNRSPKVLIMIALVFLSIAPFMTYNSGTYMEQLRDSVVELEQMQEDDQELTAEQEEMLKDWAGVSAFLGHPLERVRKDTEAYLGTYLEILSYREPTVTVTYSQTWLFYMIWRVGGIMLLGMALMKLGILSGDRSRDFYRKMMLVGYGLGIPIVVFSAWNLAAHEWEEIYKFRIGDIPNYFGSILVAFGHIALVMTIIKSGAMSGLMQRFAAVGRMAFTNYLMHSIILTTIFYGYGFGLYGQVPRLWQMGFVLAVIGLQLWISPIWLRHYRFGPAEWLWRSLTYWKRQPMLLQAQ